MNILIKPVWLLLENEVQNKIGHVDLGLHNALLSLAFILSSLSDLGINQYITKKLAHDRHNFKEVYANVLGLRLVMLIIYPIFLMLVGMVIGYSTYALYLLGILGLFQSFLQLMFFYRANFQASQDFNIDAVASILDKLLMIIFVILLLNFKIDLETFILAKLASVFIVVFIFWLISLKLYDWIKPSLDSQKISLLIKKAIPFGFITLLYSLNEKVDSVIIERLVTNKEESGLYAAAYRFLDAIMMYLWIILPIFFAKFAYHLKEDKAKQKLLNFGLVVTSLPLTYVCTFIFFNGEKLFFQYQLSTVADINTMVATLKILSIAAFLQGMFAIGSTLLTSTGYEKQVSFMIVGSIVINITLNYYFIPQYGAYAPAWVTVISTLYLSILYVVYIHRNLNINYPYKILLKLIFLYLLFVGLFYTLDQASINWIVSSILSGTFLLITAYFMGLFNEVFNEIFKNKFGQKK